MDRLEAALDKAQQTGQTSVWWDDTDNGQIVEIIYTYGRYLVDFLNSELTTPVASRWDGR